MAKAARKATEVVEAPSTETKAAVEGPKMTAAQTKAVEALPTVSARIRYLNDQGFTRGQITKLIPNAHGGKLLYQHVRNVLVTPIAKAKA